MRVGVGRLGVEAKERELRMGCWEAEGETSFSIMVPTHQPVSLAFLVFVLPSTSPYAHPELVYDSPKANI